MPVIETTLHANYQPEWSAAEAIRELVSNAMDGQIRGLANGTGRFTHSCHPALDATDGLTLTLTNAGVQLPLSVLLMGASGSRGNEDCIGQFGEGLPLALLVLAREGYSVLIENGDEVWTPFLRYSTKLGGKVLCVQTRKLRKSKGHFSVQVNGLMESDWTETRKKFLCFTHPAYDTSKNQLLLEQELSGSVYVKGVFVSKINALFGYNLTEVQLNRDRSAALDTYQIRIGGAKTLLPALYEAHKQANQSRFNHLMGRIVLCRVGWAGEEIGPPYGEPLELATSWGPFFSTIGNLEETEYSSAPVDPERAAFSLTAAGQLFTKAILGADAFVVQQANEAARLSKFLPDVRVYADVMDDEALLVPTQLVSWRKHTYARQHSAHLPMESVCNGQSASVRLAHERAQLLTSIAQQTGTEESRHVALNQAQPDMCVARLGLLREITGAKHLKFADGFDPTDYVEALRLHGLVSPKQLETDEGFVHTVLVMSNMDPYRPEHQALTRSMRRLLGLYSSDAGLLLVEADFHPPTEE